MDYYSVPIGGLFSPFGSKGGKGRVAPGHVNKHVVGEGRVLLAFAD